MKLKIDSFVLNYAVLYQRDITSNILKDEKFLEDFYELTQEMKLKISLEEYQNLLVSKRLYSVFFRKEEELFSIKRWRKIHKELFDEKYSMRKLAKILGVMDELNEAPMNGFLPRTREINY